MIALVYMTISKKPKSPTQKFICWTAIQHVRTKKILTVDTSNGTIKLQSNNCNDSLTSIIFGMWKKEKCGDIIGLQNKANKKWLGQNLFGSISCNSFKFSRREEWEVCLSLQIKLCCIFHISSFIFKNACHIFQIIVLTLLIKNCPRLMIMNIYMVEKQPC